MVFWRVAVLEGARGTPGGLALCFFPWSLACHGDELGGRSLTRVLTTRVLLLVSASEQRKGDLQNHPRVVLGPPWEVTSSL